MNLAIQSAGILLDIALTLYTMIRTKYMPYIWIASFLFLGPALLAWTYTLYITCYWVILRPTSEPRLRQPLLSHSRNTTAFESADQGPLDLLYQRQQERVRRSQDQADGEQDDHLPIQCDADRQNDIELSQQAAASNSSITGSRDQALLLHYTTHGLANNDRPNDPSRNYGTVDRSSSALHFSRQIRTWNAHLPRYLALLLLIVFIDILVLIESAIGMSFTYSRGAPIFPSPSL